MNMDWLSDKCGTYQEAISLMAADRLPKAEKEALEAHLKRCARCSTEFAKLKRLSSEFNAWKATLADIEPSGGASFRLRQALRDVQRTPQPVPAPSISRWWLLAEKKVLLGALGTVWALILFFNLDSPQLIAMGERCQPISANAILMVLREARSFQWPDAQEPPRQTKHKDPYQTKGGEDTTNPISRYC